MNKDAFVTLLCSFAAVVISTGILRDKDGEPRKDVTHPIKAGAEAFAGGGRIRLFQTRIRSFKVNAPVVKERHKSPIVV